MATYKVVGATAVHLRPSRSMEVKLCRPGEVIEFDGVPGIPLMPLDADAAAAKAATITNATLNPSPGWHMRLVQVAKSLGYKNPAGATFEDARTFVIKWLEHPLPVSPV